MTRRRASVAVVAVLLAAMTAVPGHAQTSGSGQLGPDYVRATASDLGAGSFPGSGLPSAEPARESNYSWSRATTGGRCVVFPGPVPPNLAEGVSPLPGIVVVPGSPVHLGTLQGAPPGAVRLAPGPPLPPGVTSPGDFVLDTATPRAGGPDVFVVPRCAPPAAPFFPPPPSAAAIWQQTPLPRARVHASPPGTRAWPGIVNLESRFWSTPLPDARATVDLDGYVVSVVAHPIAYAWSFGDGTVSMGASPGGPDGPARATFRRRGDYGVTLYVVWSGLAHITAPAWGLDFGEQYLGTVTLPEAAGYHEAEIRALLRTRTARG